MKLRLKKGVLFALGGCALLTVGFGALIYFAHSNINEEKEAIETKRQEAQMARAKLAELPVLEKKVLILREVVKEYQKILPSSKEVNGFIRKLYNFQDEAGVQIQEINDTSEKSSKGPAASKEPGFNKVSYSLKVECNLWQFLSFLSRLESYERFVRVPKINVKAGERSKDDDFTKTRHKFDLDLETFVFNASALAKQEKIENYEKRVNDLQDEISRAKEKILSEPYEYHGPRGRRDPFIDPRLRVPTEGGGMAALQRQVDIVDKLQAQLAGIGQMVLDYDKADNSMIRRFELRRDIGQSISSLLEDVEKANKEGRITYLPLVRRLQRDVVDALADLRGRFYDEKNLGDSGPSVEELKEIAKQVRIHMAEGQFAIAIDRYNLISDRIKLVENDPARRDLVMDLQRLHRQAKMAQEFSKKSIQVEGIIVSDKGSVAVINGRSFAEGDYIDDDLLVRKIQPDSIEFQYRDVVISKKI